MEKIFTGLIVRDDFDLNNLELYGFYKTQPKRNPWWQCFFGTNYEACLLININDRKLLLKSDKDYELSEVMEAINKMKSDDIFE